MTRKEWKEDGDTDGGSRIVLVESGGDDRQTLNICGTFSARTNPFCFDLGIKVADDKDSEDNCDGFLYILCFQRLRPHHVFDYFREQ